MFVIVQILSVTEWQNSTPDSLESYSNKVTNTSLIKKNPSKQQMKLKVDFCVIWDDKD